jgi:hypothetical protein
MGEALCGEAATGQAQVEAVVGDCLEAETTRGLAPRTLAELEGYLVEFTLSCLSTVSRPGRTKLCY